MTETECFSVTSNKVPQQKQQQSTENRKNVRHKNIKYTINVTNNEIGIRFPSQFLQRLHEHLIFTRSLILALN